MPRGHAAPHEVICRACDQPFTTTKVGRASWFCRRQACDEARGLRTPAPPAPERSPAPAAPEPVRAREPKPAPKPAPKPPKPPPEPPAPPKPVLVAGAPPVVPATTLGAILERMYGDVRARGRQDPPTRRTVQRLVVRLATAQGGDATAEALYALAVECIAWYWKLKGGVSARETVAP